MIIQLHQNLINKIAAGEVVERPASVVKELVENALDAEASRIEVNIKNAGKKLIEVIDDGVGMDRDDATIATDTHTTSKVASIEDLEKIQSMGFRGEALASISSVSTLTLTTKTKKDSAGTKIVVDKGKKSRPQETAAKQGTTVSVEQLFHNIPARQKFLKTDNTEYRHILNTFHNYALAHPNVHFILTHNTKGVYNLPSITGDNFKENLRSRIFDLFGKEVSEELVNLHYDSPYIQINGFTGHPRLAKSQRTYQLQFLNKRPISDRIIAKAALDAYQGLIPKGKYPAFFIFLQIRPDLVDVNVHPRKTEVRFENPQDIYSGVKNAVKQAILNFLKKDTNAALEMYPQKPSVSPKSTFDQEKRNARIFGGSSKESHAKRPARYTSSDIDQSMRFTKELLSGKRQVPQKQLIANDYFKTFQVFNCFIILEKDDKLLFIDQHAADERITFEKLTKRFRNDSIEKQPLLLPQMIELNEIQLQVMSQYNTQLQKLGITVTEFGKKEYQVTEIPVILAKSNPKELVLDVLSDLAEEYDAKDPESFEDTVDHVIATMACHSSIRGGMKLLHEEIRDLVKKLLACDNPYACPHGRPIIWEMSRGEMERKFGRP